MSTGMRNKRAPRIDQRGVHGPIQPERIRRIRTQPHTNTEDNMAYLLLALLGTALILACVGLSQVSWRVLPRGGDDAFGIVKVHMDGETHYLETMGCVWSVYTASRCAYAFTLIGIIFAFWTMRSTSHFLRLNRGGFPRLLRGAFWTSTWFLWAIMLYALLFPFVPFHGDLSYIGISPNTTIWGFNVARPGFGGSGSVELMNTQQQQLLVHPVWKPEASQQTQLNSVDTKDQHATPIAAAQSDLSHDRLLNLAAISSLPPSHLSDQPLHLAVPSVHRSNHSAFLPAPLHAAGSSYLDLRALHSIPRAFAAQKSVSRAGPSFPTPTGGGSSGSNGDPYTNTASQAVFEVQYFYALTAFAHIGDKWTFGAGYWLVLTAALVSILLPFLCVVWLLVNWCHVRHVESGGVQQKWAIPPVVILWVGWMLAIIGFASRYWKVAQGNYPNYDTHFGLDQFYLDSSRHTVRYFGFFEKQDRIHDASNLALSFGVLGILSGFVACLESIYHVYDTTHEPILSFVLVTTTAVLWLIALIVYGAVFPHYIGVEYFEFGWSFWLTLCATLIFFLPFLTFVAYRIYVRAKETTREERIMFIPTCFVTFSLMFTMAALGSDQWSTKGPDDHLGLLRGRVDGVWVEYQALAEITSTTKIGSAGVASLVLVLCGICIQFPTWLLGWQFVLGNHNGCARQMPLVCTALNLSSMILYALGVSTYRALMPWNLAVMDGFDLSHSWRVQITAAAWSLLAAVAFGYLAKPPLPGEPNVLAAALPSSPATLGGGSTKASTTG